MSDKIRVTIFTNGDYTSGGKVLVLENIHTLQDLLTRAQTKLGSEQPFKRVFVDSGAEVTDVEDILRDDKLYFSTGADFIRITELATAIPSSDTKSDDAEKKKFLQNIAVTAVTQASQLYDSTSTYVKNRSPEFVKVTLEKVEGTVAAVGKPLYTQVVEYGTPAINWADEKIDSAYDKVRRRSLQFLQSDFAKTVNNVLQPIKQRIQQPEQISSEISAFYHAAVDQFQSLDKTGTGRVSYEDFIAGLKLKLGSAWNEKLVEPSKSFYAQVQSEYESTVQKVSDKTEESKIQAVNIFNNAKQKLGQQWETAVEQHFKPTQQQIIELFHTRVTQPAEAFYSSAWASYLALGGVDGSRPVTSAEFLAGLRVKLGTMWNDKLVAPAQHLYESFRAEYQAQQQQAQAQEQARNGVENVSMDDIESELAAELTKSK